MRLGMQTYVARRQTMIKLEIGGKTKRSTLGQRTVEIDWDNLPDASKAFIQSYGLRQYLADAMAGAEDEADATARVEARRDKLVSGDLSRSRGEGLDKPDTVETRAMRLAKAAVRDQAKVKSVALTKEQVATAAKTWVDKNPKWLAEAKKQLEAEAKAKEAVDADEADDILADLLRGADEEEADEDED
jgi:hypothetical protein